MSKSKKAFCTSDLNSRLHAVSVTTYCAGF